MRPDSIPVVSIDAETGQAVTIGLPRNMVDVPFADGSPLQAVYPEGYGAIDGCEVDVCMLNSIYTEVELKSPEHVPRRRLAGLRARDRGDAGCRGGHHRACRSSTTCSSTCRASSSSSTRSAASP